MFLKLFKGLRSTKCRRKDCEYERFDNKHYYCGKHLSDIGTWPCCGVHTCSVCGKFAVNGINVKYDISIDSLITEKTMENNYENIEVELICQKCIDKHNLLCQKSNCQDIANNYNFFCNTIVNKNSQESIYCKDHECYHENCINGKNCPYHSCGIKDCSERPNQTGYCLEHSNSFYVNSNKFGDINT